MEPQSVNGDEVRSGAFDIIEVVELDPIPVKVTAAPLQHREHTRRILAYSLLALLAAVVVYAGVLVSLHYQLEAVRGYLDLVFGSLVTLTASVLGFYFGAAEKYKD